jgi:hypothetical protein
VFFAVNPCKRYLVAIILVRKWLDLRIVDEALAKEEV